MPTNGEKIQEKVMLVDGHSLLHRAFYALPTMTTSKGEHTNAALGFTNMLLRLLEDETPAFIGVAFDLSGPTFRHEQFEDYKGHRPSMPDDLVPQVEMIKQIVKGFAIPVLELDGYEADDIIGTLARHHGALDREVLIVTGDRDCLQLVDENVKALITRRGIRDLEIYDVKHVEKKHGVPPNLMADLKGLMGDASDNIPGVPGIGPKTGSRLLQKFGSLEEVLANVDKLRGKQKENVIKYAEQARLSRKLATIHCGVPVELELPPYGQEHWKQDELYELFSRLEFRSLISRLSLSSLDVDVDSDTKPSDRSQKAAETFDFELLDSLSQAREFAEKLSVSLQEGGCVYLDPYIDNPDSVDAELAAIGISCGERGGLVSRAILSECQELKGILENTGVDKVCFDAKFLLHALRNIPIDAAGTRFDISLAAYLLDSSQNVRNIENVLLDMLDVVVPSLEKLTGKGAKRVPVAEVALRDLAELSRQRMVNLAPLHKELADKLETNSLDTLYHDVELPLVKVLVGMEREGVAVDVQELRTISQELDGRLQDLSQAIYEHAGMEFNINSPKQLAEVLFDKLELPVIKKTKTGPSTNAEVLEALAEHHEIAELLMDYRQLGKLKSTYLDSLETLIHPVSERIHTSFHQTITATGRLSSVNPNLQNIPVRTEEGRRIRKAFVAGATGWVLLTADYSQIELRVLAHMAQDTAWLDAFRAGADIHSRTAAEVFEVPADEVTEHLRDAAKAINFGIVYGISSFGLAKGTGLTRQDAQTYIDRYFDKYAGVKMYLDETVATARQKGYVETLFGRRRYLPDINSRRWAARNFAERAAMNAPIQGTAADIIKMAMVSVARELENSGLKAKMLIQVHDELVFAVDEKDLHDVQSLVKKVMESVVDLSVPLVVDIKAGPNWRDAVSIS
ncbi:MAG: DNA polymerase I [Firmicutes bacterium]|nr:DNA polymerase I [Bacillota bacterium]